MAINTGNEKQENRQNTTAQPTGNVERETTRSVRRAEGFGGAVRSVRRSFSRRATSEIVRGYKTAFDNIINQTEAYSESASAGQYKFYCFPVDGDLNGLPISSLVFVREEQGFSAAVVLSLAATCGELSDRYVKAGRDQYGNTKQIALPQTPSDIWEYSGSYRRVLQEEVENKLGRSKYEVIGNIVLPAHVTAEDTDILDSTLWRIVDNLENYLVANGKFDQVSTPSLGLLKANESLKSRLEFNQPQGVDSLGNVRRQDVNVRIISEENERDEDGEVKTTEVGCVTGYVDSVYVGREPSNNDTIWRTDNVQSFMPAFIITSVDSGQDAVTPESIGFNLAAVSVLARENRWVASFRSQGTKNPLRHVGALGCLIPALESPISSDGSYTPMGKVVNDATFRYSQFCQWAFEWDSLLFMLDIEESGEMSPMLATIADIAISNDKGALKYWNDAMDYLTEGRYSQIWKDAGEPRIFEDMDLRIPLGTVRLEENSDKEFDLRTLDQVAIANLEDDESEAGLEEIEAYNEAMYGTTFSGEARTEVICRYIRSRYAGLVKFTGYARRVRVTTALLDILAEAFEANGAAIEPDQNFDGFSQRRRGNASFRRDGYSANDSAMFRRGASQRASGSRWGGMRQGWRN